MLVVVIAGWHDIVTVAAPPKSSKVEQSVEARSFNNAVLIVLLRLLPTLQLAVHSSHHPATKGYSSAH